MPVIKVLQINLGRSRTAQDLMLQTAREIGAEVVIASELYKPPRDNARWAVDEHQNVAIIAAGAYPIQHLWGSAVPGLVVATIAGIAFASCYASPSTGLEDFKSFVEAAEMTLIGHPLVVMAGDFNAWHQEWGSARTTRKGELVMGAADHLGLRTLNRGNEPTFKGNGVARESVIDVSFASPSIALDDWRVYHRLSGSDHQYIQFSVATGAARDASSRRMQPQRQPRQGPPASSGTARHAGVRWKTAQFDRECFKTALALGHFEQQSTPEGLIGGLSAACDGTMERVHGATYHQSPKVYWWTPELDRLREDCEAAEERRRHAHQPADRAAATARWLDSRRALGKAIQYSKERCWTALIDTVEDDVFGLGYKVVMAKLRGRTPPETDRAVLEPIVDTLFPTHPPFVWPAIETGNGDEELVRPITREEVLLLAGKMASSKAPGLDGIPNAAMKAAMHEHPDVFVRVFNDLLQRGEFPQSWKVARLVLVAKPGKEPGDPSAYRPLLMLGAAPKAFERLILDRLNDHLESSSAPRLSQEQYGFRRGRSTVQAIQRVVDRALHARSFHRTNSRDPRCLMVAALDVKNAFNSASWTAIATALQEMRVPPALQRILRSYFCERELVFETSEGPVRKPVTAGVPQGSILGPTLWNAMYDGVLRLALPEGVETIGFADDLVVLAGGTTPQAAAELAENAINTISRWMAEHHLELAPAKTELVMVSTMRRSTTLHPVTVSGVERWPTRSLRYLGVVIEDHLSWKPHVEYAVTKALRAAKGVSRLLRNHSGPKCAKRRLLASVVDSTLRYAAPVWHEAVQLQACRRKLTRVQGIYARPVARTFTTVRYEVATVLASTIPICLLIGEDARCYQRRQTTNLTRQQVHQEERATTMGQWQVSWDELQNTSRFTRWTYRVIPDIAAWKNRQHGEMTFHLAQLLSGHGFFHDYLNAMHISPSSDCARCPGVAETAEHAFFQCPRFADVRQELLEESDVPVVTPESMTSYMLSSSERWSKVCEAAKIITTALQQDWYVERATSADIQMAAAAQRTDEAHDRTVRERRERRNELRRERTRERRSHLPPPTHPDGRPFSEEEIAEREEQQRQGRNRLRRHRARRRVEQGEEVDARDYLWALFGVDAFADEERTGPTSVQTAAASEAERSGR